MKQTNIKRGDVFWVDFDPSQATEIKKTRPSVILSHDAMNENFTRVIVAPITSNIKKVYPFEYLIIEQAKLKGKIMFDQMRAVDKSRLGNKLTSLSVKEIRELEYILKHVLGLT